MRFSLLYGRICNVALLPLGSVILRLVGFLPFLARSFDRSLGRECARCSLASVAPGGYPPLVVDMVTSGIAVNPAAVYCHGR